MCKTSIKILGSFSKEEVESLGVDLDFSEGNNSVHSQIVSMGESIVDEISTEIYSENNEYAFLEQFKNGQVTIQDKSGAFLKVVVTVKSENQNKEIVLMAVDNQTNELI